MQGTAFCSKLFSSPHLDGSDLLAAIFMQLHSHELFICLKFFTEEKEKKKKEKKVKKS